MKKFKIRSDVSGEVYAEGDTLSECLQDALKSDVEEELPELILEFNRVKPFEIDEDSLIQGDFS